MHQKTLRIRVFLIVLFIVFLLAGCSGQEANAASEAQPAEKRVTTEKSETAKQDASAGTRKTQHEFLLPEASGSTVYENDIISIDASNISEGYIMVRYSGDADKIRLQITAPTALCIITQCLPAPMRPSRCPAETAPIIWIFLNTLMTICMPWHFLRISR